MFGGSGADTLHGGDDDDRVHGGSGDDLVTGDHGSDRLYGGDGDDRIGLLYDRDTVTGGDGADEFAFISGRGAITDFAPGEDFVNLIAFDELGSLADVTAVATEIAGDLLLDLGDDRLVLRDTVLSDSQRSGLRVRLTRAPGTGFASGFTESIEPSPGARSPQRLEQPPQHVAPRDRDAGEDQRRSRGSARATPAARRSGTPAICVATATP